jgi:hypothetical protein
MPVDFIDDTGKPRSSEDIKEALMAVENAIVKDTTKIPPRLYVLLPTIRESLMELLQIRKIIRELKNKNNG